MTQPGTSACHEHDDEGYRGPATLTVAGVDHEVTLTLLGHVEPLDGRFRWYGRVAAHAALDAALQGRKRPVRVVTPVGAADGEVSDVDPWGRYRIAGVSTPPFPVRSPEDSPVDGLAGSSVAGVSGVTGGSTA